MSKKILIVLTLFLAGCGVGQDINTAPSEKGKNNAVVETNEANVESKTKTLFVDSQLSKCVGVAPMSCMKIRTDASKEWTFFYGEIEGFEFEPGFTYELLVEESKVDNPPADASSIKTKLVEIVKKEAVATTSLQDTQWVYQSMQANGVKTPVLADSEITLDFTENNASGSAGCNRFSGDFTQSGTQLSFKSLASTERACLRAELNQQESTFLQSLRQVSTFSLQDQTLVLQSDDKTQLVFKIAKP